LLGMSYTIYMIFFRAIGTILTLAILVTSINVSPVQAATIRPIIFPVQGPHHFKDDFSELRDGTRMHEAIDIISAKMTPVLAVMDAVVTNVVSPEASWGYALTIRDADGYSYRYIHLNNDTPGTDDGKGGAVHAYAPGVVEGATVRKGQVIAWVGDSGNAEAVGAHLHFEMYDPSRTPINPYESLVAAPTTAVVGVPTSYNDNSSVGTDTSHLINPLSGGGISIVTIPTGTPTVSLPAGQASVGATATTTPYIFTKPLSLGSRGEDVRQLQIILKALGYFQYPVITGYFGNATHASVVMFQSAKLIDPIGIVGPKTRTSLNNL
jgi:hypothetical protein